MLRAKIGKLERRTPGQEVEPEEIGGADLVIEPRESPLGVAAVVQVVPRDLVEEAIALLRRHGGKVAETAGLTAKLRDIGELVETACALISVLPKNRRFELRPERVVMLATPETLEPNSAGMSPVKSSMLCTMLLSTPFPKAPVNWSLIGMPSMT